MEKKGKENNEINKLTMLYNNLQRRLTHHNNQYSFTTLSSLKLK